MKLSLPVLCLLASFAVHANAADMARLEWGSFVVEDDSSNGWDAYKAVSSDDGNTMRMTFAPLDAKADGATPEATARISGHYDVIQPDFDSFTHCVVTVEGHIIKSNGAVARLVVRIGDSENVIEWPTGSAASEKFSRNVEVALPKTGRLPNPFNLSLDLSVRKEGASDAAYVSVDALTIAASTAAQVAAN